MIRYERVKNVRLLFVPNHSGVRILIRTAGSVRRSSVSACVKSKTLMLFSIYVSYNVRIYHPFMALCTKSTSNFVQATQPINASNLLVTEKVHLSSSTWTAKSHEVSRAFWAYIDILAHLLALLALSSTTSNNTFVSYRMVTTNFIPSWNAKLTTFKGVIVTDIVLGEGEPPNKFGRQCFGLFRVGGILQILRRKNYDRYRRDTLHRLAEG